MRHRAQSGDVPRLTELLMCHKPFEKLSDIPPIVLINLRHKRSGSMRLPSEPAVLEAESTCALALW